MPVFHTKTIESILDPVAQQVSRLVILHEEAEDGNAMPDLEKPVSAVSQAVKNLVHVGRETIHSSDDEILKVDMPGALVRVEGASKLLEEASTMLKQDPLSQAARKKLIEGSRGILQGTSSLLLCFDESEVRKIIRDSKKVMEYLAVAEVVDSLEDLVRFVQDLSPCLSKVSREIDGRQKELTHQVHREILLRCMEEVKNLTPILICSMKIYIQIHDEGGKGKEEATLNRDYLVQRMTDEINEIIRVLQLTTYDEDEWDSDNLTALKRTYAAIDSLWQSALDWLRDPRAVRFGVGEKATRKILEEAERMSDKCLPADTGLIRKLCGDITSMVDGVCELRQNGAGSTAQAESLAKGAELKLTELRSTAWNAMAQVEKLAKAQPAYTVSGRLDQALLWLETQNDDDGLGQRAIGRMVQEARQVAECLPHGQGAELDRLADDTSELLQEVLQARKRGNDGQAQETSRALLQKLVQLRNAIQSAVIHRVVDDFVDTMTPVKEFSRVVTTPDVPVPQLEPAFAEKAAVLGRFSSRVSRTAKMVSAGGCGDQKKLAELLVASAHQLDSLTPQLVNAGRIRMGNEAANEHFENLRLQYEYCLHRLRLHCDEAIDASQFITESENSIRVHSAACEEAIQHSDPQQLVERTSKIARLANRVLMVLKQETDNSEDADFIHHVSGAADEVQRLIPLMVYSAKDVALNFGDEEAIHRWRGVNDKLIASVGNIATYLRGASEDLPLTQDFGRVQIELAPQRPPLPDRYVQPPRPPPPADTDDEETEDMFTHIPQPNQPIMVAAHGLHQEVKQWSSKDNEIVSSAKRMALLMARLSQLVRGEGGTKKELIACAKDIAEASDEVTKLAKELAQDCTDKRMRTNLLQVCERIPTIGTQLKILSTVKATMLGAQGTEEDKEATEMLVGNAQNLMQSVKETVRAAEAASIKIRTDAGLRLRWVRKQPWYKN